MGGFKYSRPAQRTRGKILDCVRGDSLAPIEFRSGPRKPRRSKTASRNEAEALVASFLQAGGQVRRIESEPEPAPPGPAARQSARRHQSDGSGSDDPPF